MSYLVYLYVFLGRLNHQSGGLCSSQLHVARSVCRRAERRVVNLGRETPIQTSVPIYLNRLSDFFFVAARFASLGHRTPEQIYKKV